MTARLVLISGWATVSDMWEPLVDAMDDSHELERVDWWTLLEDGASAAFPMDADSEVVLIGWSLGGMLALRAALRRPGRIAGMVIVSGTSRMMADQGYPAVPPAALRVSQRQLLRNRGAYLESFFVQCFAPRSDGTAVAGLCESARRIESRALVRGLEFMMQGDVRASLPDIAVPTLIVHGDRDEVVPPFCGEHLARRIPRARLELLSGMGHALPLCAVDPLAEAIGGFIDDCTT